MKKRYDANYLDQLSHMLAPLKAQSYSWLNCQDGECVVDAGCGVGSDAAKLALSGASIIALDIDDDFLAEGRLRYGDAVSFHKRHVEDTGLEACKVDKCRMDRVLQHIHRPERALSEMSRVLRPGGILQIVDCDYQSLSLFMDDINLERKLTDSVVNRFVGARNLRILPELLRQAGFGDLAVSVHHTVVYGYDNAKYLINFDQIISDATTSGQLMAQELEAWRRWKESPTCQLSLRFVLLQAHKLPSDASRSEKPAEC